MMHDEHGGSLGFPPTLLHLVYPTCRLTICLTDAIPLGVDGVSASEMRRASAEVRGLDAALTKPTDRQADMAVCTLPCAGGRIQMVPPFLTWGTDGFSLRMLPTLARPPPADCLSERAVKWEVAARTLC